MKLITPSIKTKLEKNWTEVVAKYEAGDSDINETIVCKLFNPCGAATWLLTQLDPDDGDIMYGLADLGFGCVEYGSISLSELQALKLPMGLTIERDLHFDPKGRKVSDFLSLTTLCGIS